MSDITVTPETYGTLCICAVRYALGRMTYMPDEVANAVGQGLDKLTQKDMAVILKDIRAYALNENSPIHKDINQSTWHRLGNRLDDEIKRRKER